MAMKGGWRVRDRLRIGLETSLLGAAGRFVLVFSALVVQYLEPDPGWKEFHPSQIVERAHCQWLFDSPHGSRSVVLIASSSCAVNRPWRIRFRGDNCFPIIRQLISRSGTSVPGSGQKDTYLVPPSSLHAALSSLDCSDGPTAPPFIEIGGSQKGNDTNSWASIR